MWAGGGGPQPHPASQRKQQRGGDVHLSPSSGGRHVSPVLAAPRRGGVKVGPPSGRIPNDVEPLQRGKLRLCAVRELGGPGTLAARDASGAGRSGAAGWSPGRHQNQPSGIKGRSVGTVLENQSARPSGKRPLLGPTAGASTDASLSRERRGSASFRNIKAIAGDKGKKGDGSGAAWTCPPASSCGQLPDCPPPHPPS